MIVDGHAHVWTLETATYPWQPTFGFVPTEAAAPADLLTVMDRHAVSHALLVQPSAYGRDHRFLLDTVRTHPDRFLAIGLVDPTDLIETTDALALVREGRCVGLRVNLSLDLDLAEAQATGSGWAALESLGAPVCVRATPAHHHLVTGILGRHRDLSLVVDHLGLPAPDRFAEAAERFTELARYAQCWLKVAGLARLSGSLPPYPDTWPVVRAALRSFGSSRLLWGSDFPATDGADGYAASIEAIESMPFVTSADRDRLLWETSSALWGVPPKTSPP